MLCKKCRESIDDSFVYCPWCGAAQRKDRKKALYQRPDGLYEKSIMIQDKRVTFRAKSEAELWQKIAQHQQKAETGALFSEVAESWEIEHFSGISYNTQKSYTAPLKRAVAEFGNRPIKEIPAKDIKNFIVRFSKGMSEKTVRNQLLVVRLIFEYAMVNYSLESNPSEYVTVPKNLNRGKRSLPEDACIDLVKSSTDKPFGLLAYFLLYTGCRIGEAIALTGSDIDRTEKLIHISKSVYHENNKPHIKTPKTAAGERDIILLNCLDEKLPTIAPHELLFPGKSGGIMTYSELKHGWEQYCKSIGQYTTTVYTDKDKHKHERIKPNFTPHQLRHGYATILFEAGIDDKDAQELMGHTSIVITRDDYTHIRKKRLSETAKKLNEYVSK